MAVKKISEYHKRKLARVDHFFSRVYMNKLIPCTACGGYGSYKNGKCGSCDGTGKERIR
jgi:DnaJ-class molecular chaperone